MMVGEDYNSLNSLTIRSRILETSTNKQMRDYADESSIVQKFRLHVFFEPTKKCLLNLKKIMKLIYTSPLGWRPRWHRPLLSFYNTFVTVCMEVPLL